MSLLPGARFQLVRDNAGFKTQIGANGLVLVKVVTDGRIHIDEAEALAERIVESLNRHQNRTLDPSDGEWIK